MLPLDVQGTALSSEKKHAMGKGGTINTCEKPILMSSYAAETEAASSLSVQC